MFARWREIQYACCACCSGGPDSVEHEMIETRESHSAFAAEAIPKKRVSTLGQHSMLELLEVLKRGGGPVDSPTAEQNKAFFTLLDSIFPELHIYRTGKIQTSPGVEEIEGSPTEYYRTVGAMIGLLACYAEVHGDPFGLDAVSAGERGPMSMDKVPGKFINIGNKPKEYNEFCRRFASYMANDDDWWAMMVFLSVHDVGKSDAFRNAVNATLPADQRTDDHDRILGMALANYELKENYLPTVLKLSPKRQQMLLDGFQTNFQLPQLGQGEIAVVNLCGLTDLPKTSLDDGTLISYLYHSIFDIAGASSNEKFVFPIALVPVYIGFSSAMVDLISSLKKTNKPDEHSVYFSFLYGTFKKAYPKFESEVFAPMCESVVFREETGLVVLRILALTRNTYKNPQNVLDLCLKHQSLVWEMCGKPNSPGPQIMLYYGPDMLRMGLGEDLDDVSGENMEEAMHALEDLYALAREEIKFIRAGRYQYQLNVQGIVSEIKKAGKSWAGGSQLKQLCNRATIVSNDMKTEGLVVLPSKSD